ncbi:hypothetical protein B296_00058733 [Ensete ventricosum]|uniref:Transposase (putative) gypsy type domain-containing protein n=1 Tax=Ensete ventricosum TaxID=4639 RepID=A0A426WYN2_ENSVE|nr:hypothetical protein B296_00058733 [Ensete ventricosum]
MTSSDSSSSVRVVSPLGSGETSRCDPEVGSSGASSGPPSPVDARVLRALEVMKSDHDLDTTMTEGSLAVIRERYSIPVEYGLHVPQPGQRPYSLDAPGMCISVDALEAGLWFPLHPLIEECLRWWRVSPSQVAPNSWRYIVVFLGECRGVGIIPTRDLFMACFHLCKSRDVWGFRLDWSAHPIGNASPYLSEVETVLVDKLKEIFSSLRAIKEMAELWLIEAGLSPASRDQMDLGELRGMPKVESGKVPPTRPIAREVGASPARVAPKASLKRPVVSPPEQAEEAVRRHKKVKVLTRRHKSHPSERESRSRSKGNEPSASLEEPEAPVGSEKGGASPAHERSRSMKDLFKTKVHKGDAGYYALIMSDLGHQDPEKEMKTRWKGLKNSTKVWNNSSAAEVFESGLLHPQLARELYMLPSKVLIARAAKEMVLAMKDLESTRAELPRQSIIQYKESLGFKEDLKRMGRVTYEYGYRVALARFRARHPDVDVEEDPFTIHPEDDLVPMERQQDFDDSVPLEP